MNDYSREAEVTKFLRRIFYPAETHLLSFSAVKLISHISMQNLFSIPLLFTSFRKLKTTQRMQLNHQILTSLRSEQGIQLPHPNAFDLPEKVFQFGTGVLLRGLPDFYINKANNEGIFNGRVVVIKSTGSGNNKDAFATQNNLYTHCIKGIENDEIKEEYIINAAISRVINANEAWQTVLECAHNPQLQIIISNTTEVGIALQENDDINALPPQSFPGKLLSFLYERYKTFGGSNDSGMIIIPTELLVDNGAKLKAIVVELAKLNQLETVIHYMVRRSE